jgi:hypothetical protein
VVALSRVERQATENVTADAAVALTVRVSGARY